MAANINQRKTAATYLVLMKKQSNLIGLFNFYFPIQGMSNKNKIWENYLFKGTTKSTSVCNKWELQMGESMV